MKRKGVFVWILMLASTALIFSKNILAATVDVTFNGSAFSPAQVTVTVGDTVKWTNTSSSTYVEIASDPHPTHTNYPALNLGTVNPNGGTISLIFNQTGTYGYHNHLDSNITGTITVQAASVNPSPTSAPSATPTNVGGGGTPTPSPEAIPVTGSTTPTLLLISLSLFLLTTGVVTVMKSMYS